MDIFKYLLLCHHQRKVSPTAQVKSICNTNKFVPKMHPWQQRREVPICCLSQSSSYSFRIMHQQHLCKIKYIKPRIPSQIQVEKHCAANSHMCYAHRLSIAVNFEVTHLGFTMDSGKQLVEQSTYLTVSPLHLSHSFPLKDYIASLCYSPSGHSLLMSDTDPNPQYHPTPSINL